MKNYKIESEESKRYTQINAGLSFEDGSAARVIETYAPAKEPIRIPREHEIKRYEPEPEYEVRKAPGIGRAVDLFFAAVLMVAIMITLYVCINYLQIQSDIVQLEKQISVLENTISVTENENKALEASINVMGSDLDYVYNVAVGVLGMVYPNKNEVHFYTNQQSSYYRDYAAVN